MKVTFADSAQVVVIGGGIIGCSVAYHLACSGLRDVLVIERNDIATAATARSAGLLSHARSDRNVIRMINRTRAAIPELEDELGESIDFRKVGAIRAVLTEDRERELRAMETCLAAEGISIEDIGPAQAREMCPWLDVASARRTVFVPVDGYLDAARLAMAYARAARGRGVRIWRGVEVTGLVRDGTRIVGVNTSSGAVRAAEVVDAAGAWSVEVARWAGKSVGAAPTRSHYWITAPNGAGAPGRPNVMLPDLRAHIRSEVGGLLIGIQEPKSKTLPPLGLPRDMSTVSLVDESADIDLLLEQAAPLRQVAPEMDGWGFAHHIAGLSMYTPDGKFIIGRFDGLTGFLVASGCCGSGAAASGGIGVLVADLILDRSPEVDTAIFDPNRFGPIDPTTEEFRARCAAARAAKSRGRLDPAEA
jgi:sarcosine oxidase, subunit beta